MGLAILSIFQFSLKPKRGGGLEKARVLGDRPTSQALLESKKKEKCLNLLRGNVNMLVSGSVDPDLAGHIL
jgi:hypothetical protein